ncbi:MAG TPA: FAD-binding oxidoreductase, partial [Nocardioides sp.]
MPLSLAGLDGRPVTIDDQALQRLRTRLRLPPLLPGDPGFDEACRLWNGMITHRPALVAQPCGTADVMTCLELARERRVLLSVKGGGHNVAGTAVAPGGLLLDMSRMRGVFVDRAARTARVQAGCLLRDVDAETQVHGLAAVLGFVSETGVAGLTLGGGLGYLTRRFGWTVDTLVEVEVVTADGKVCRAAADEHPELFWALRGGGGNFGVATSFLFRLFEVGPTITGGLLAFDGARAEEVLACFAEVAAGARRELTCASTLRMAPPAPFLPKGFHGKPMVGLVVCHTGSPDQARADLAPLRALADPVADLVVERPYLDQQRLLDATQPKGLHYYWKSEYLKALPRDLLAVARERAAAQTSPLSQLIFFHLEGAIAERDAGDGAVGNRDAAFVCNVAGGWRPDDPAGASHQAWVRHTWESIRPFSTGGA